MWIGPSRAHERHAKGRVSRDRGQIELPGGHAEFGGNRFRKGGGFAICSWKLPWLYLVNKKKSDGRTWKMNISYRESNMAMFLICDTVPNSTYFRGCLCHGSLSSTPAVCSMVTLIQHPCETGPTRPVHPQVGRRRVDTSC